MDKINLSLTSDNDDAKISTVHLNAAFASREMAIDFHAKVAALCRDASRAQVSRAPGDIPWPMKLLRAS